MISVLDIAKHTKTPIIAQSYPNFRGLRKHWSKRTLLPCVSQHFCANVSSVARGKRQASFNKSIILNGAVVFLKRRELEKQKRRRERLLFLFYSCRGRGNEDVAIDTGPCKWTESK